METANEIIINVQELEPRLRHQTIFDTFNSLMEGESFIIHNNHDPMPVYYQLTEMRGNIFTWDYLQKGPEWWDIRVRRDVPIIPTEDKDFILNIPVIEPQQKHATIFHVFKNTLPGNSFIIHNNHDPKPVYFQLQNMFGDTFTWEYLQQGPQWWDIKVGIKETKKSEYPNDLVINVPSLEPKLKHPTIFKTFDSLNAGDSFIIHNDHDPKPVYYQLLSEKGDVFTWEYLQEGPQWWDIRVTRKGMESSETIGEIVAKDLRKAEVFKKYGIDFCCGGKKTVRQKCSEKGIDPTQIEKELKQPIHNATQQSNLNYDEWSLDFLADYIVNTHHNYVKKYLPDITTYANKVAKVHGNHHPELSEIKELVEQINHELTIHMKEEETKLFPLIKQLVNTKNNPSKTEVEAFKNFNALINETEEEHDSIGRLLEKIRRLNNNYAIPEDACTSYKLLYKMLEEFENDLFTHIHLENNILFTKASSLCKLL
ncbi:MAG: iron-sulfur cluster repair di-iron protein [Bacteroidia bacterium]|nr:iron-sulfur cluster repair di-iron protein [Bacteroidia bacterium]